MTAVEGKENVWVAEIPADTVSANMQYVVNGSSYDPVVGDPLSNPAHNMFYGSAYNGRYWTTYNADEIYADENPDEGSGGDSGNTGGNIGGEVTPVYTNKEFYVFASPSWNAGDIYLQLQYGAQNHWEERKMTPVEGKENVWYADNLPDGITHMSPIYYMDGMPMSLGDLYPIPTDGRNMFCANYWTAWEWCTYDAAAEYKEINPYAYQQDTFYLWISDAYLENNDPNGVLTKPYTVKFSENGDPVTMTCVDEAANIWSVAVPEGTMEIWIPTLYDGAADYIYFGLSDDAAHNMYTLGSYTELAWCWSTYDPSATYVDENPYVGPGEDPGIESDGIVDSETDLMAELRAGGEVVLQGSFAISNQINVPAGVTAVLDLNGYTLSGTEMTYEGNTYIVGAVGNEGTLTVKDSKGTGKMTAGLGNIGTLTVESGVFGQLSANYGETTINGGTFNAVMIQQIFSFDEDGNQVLIYPVPVLTIHDAEIAVFGAFMGGTVNIEGGNFTGNTFMVEENNENITVSITGGTFATDVSAYVAKGYVQNESGAVVTESAAPAPEVVIPTTKPEGIEVEDEVYSEIVSSVNDNEAAKNFELSEGVEALTITLTDVAQNTETGVVTVSYDVTPVREDDSVPVTFRLPVLGEPEKVNVYHESDLYDTYDVLEKDGDKYVEITATDFSVWSVEPVADNTVTVYFDNSEAKWENVYVAHGSGNSIAEMLDTITLMTKGENDIWSAEISEDSAQVGFANGITLSAVTYGPFAVEADKIYKYEVPNKIVAKIDDAEYTSLTAAVQKAKSGDVITMVTDSTEESLITISKNVTIDLGGKTVKLPGLFITNGTVAVSNGTLIGTNSGYSTVQLYTVFGYGNPAITLTNVNVTGARHAVRIEGGTATIDGGTYEAQGSGTSHALNVGGDYTSIVTVKSGTFIGPKGTSADSGNALCVQNKATVTVEDGSFSGGKSATVSVSGTGALSIVGGTYDQDPTAYVAEDYQATEANGIWTVMPAVEEGHVAKNTATGETFTTIAAAEDAANPGDTILLLANVVEPFLKMCKGVTLDLNGKILEVQYAVAFEGSYIIDSVGGGLIKAPKGFVMLQTNNPSLPIWDAANEGYAFADLDDFREQRDSGTNSVKYTFLPYFDAAEYALIGQGAEVSGVTLKVHVTWTSANGMPAFADFVYTDDLMKQFVDAYETNRQAFILKLTGTDSVSDLGFQVCFVSERGVQLNCNG